MQEFLAAKRRLLGTKSWWETFKEDYFSKFDHESCLCCTTFGKDFLQKEFDSIRTLYYKLCGMLGNTAITREHSIHVMQVEEFRQKLAKLQTNVKLMMQRYDSLLVCPICSSCKIVMLNLINYPTTYNHSACAACHEYNVVEAIAVVIPVNDIPELIYFKYLTENNTAVGHEAFLILNQNTNVYIGYNALTTLTTTNATMLF